MYIKGYSYQALSKFLTRMESEKTEKEFFTTMFQCQMEDSYNFTCTGQKILGENYAVILGQHIKARNALRGTLTEGALLEIIRTELENPLVAAQILSHRVCFDEDTNNCVGFDSPECISTAVVSEGSTFVLVYEAGFRYIRVKTVWDVKRGLFCAQKGTAYVKAYKDGHIETDLSYIPEIKPQK